MAILVGINKSWLISLSAPDRLDAMSIQDKLVSSVCFIISASSLGLFTTILFKDNLFNNDSIIYVLELILPIVGASSLVIGICNIWFTSYHH